MPTIFNPNNLVDIYNLIAGLIITIAVPLLSKQSWPNYYKSLVLLGLSLLLAVVKVAADGNLDLTSAGFWNTVGVLIVAAQVIYQGYTKEFANKLYNLGPVKDSPAPSATPVITLAAQATGATATTTNEVTSNTNDQPSV